MIVKRFTFNILNVNTYVLIDEKTYEAIVIDPGCQSAEERKTFKDYIINNNLKIKRVLDTHLHFDHIYGQRFVEETFGVGAEACKKDITFLNHYQDLLVMFNMPMDDEALPLKGYLVDGDVIEVGSIRLNVLQVPGHSPGGLAFYEEKEHCAFVGDTILEGGIGRTDMHRGNYETLVKSIKEKLLPLPDDTMLYSGHGEPATLGHEKETNPELIKIIKS
ncbi:MAG: MBL fold metallo-hydrolase [Paludibacteraceae bacterium]|nr:MBL fold metallo-hydrolase [Paludibacteraceae bacterium]MBP5481790.1 MBL fold metallo-hydrolase [Paludibacteraceae bacterium]